MTHPAPPPRPSRLLARLPLLGRDDPWGQFARTVVVGAVNTLASLLLLNLLQFVVLAGLPDAYRTDASVTLAFWLSASATYVANRAWSFRLGATSGNLREYGTYLAANGMSLVVPLAVWWVVEGSFGVLDLLWFNLVNLMITVGVLPLKFALFRLVVFRRALGDAEPPADQRRVHTAQVSGAHRIGSNRSKVSTRS